MRFDIQARGFRLTDALRTRTEHRVREALASAADRLGQVVVRLSDNNGPRGGVDKRCMIRAELPGARVVVIEQHDADLYAAIDRATDRAGSTITRRLGKSQADRRESARLFGIAVSGAASQT